MKKSFSLRTRLVTLTLLAVAGVWLATAFATWREVRHELEELLAHPPETSASHLAHEREELAEELTEQMLKPMLFGLPVLALLLAIAIGYALAPLRQLASDVAERAPDRLDPLPVDTLPAEVRPLVARLNSLFADILRSLENERRFTADAAHELRTPLAALKAQAQVALAAIDDSQREHALRQIVAGCDRATHLVAQLLTLARLDALTADNLHPIALRPIAEQVLAASAGDAIGGHCDLVLGEGDAVILGDTLLLEVLLRNLVENALRHSGASQIGITVERQGSNAVLAVADNGCGIAPEDRERAPQRFHRGARATAGNSSGSGLGLSIVRRIAELHGGTLEIAAAASGTGAVLRVRVPLAGKVAQPPPG